MRFTFLLYLLSFVVFSYGIDPNELLGTWVLADLGAGISETGPFGPTDFGMNSAVVSFSGDKLVYYWENMEGDSICRSSEEHCYLLEGELLASHTCGESPGVNRREAFATIANDTLYLVLKSGGMYLREAYVRPATLESALQSLPEVDCGESGD